jgi:hypothetical protein
MMHSRVAYPSHSQTLRQNQKIIFLWSRYIPDNTFMKLEKRVVFPSANQASDGGLLSTECRSGVIIHVEGNEAESRAMLSRRDPCRCQLSGFLCLKRASIDSGGVARGRSSNVDRPTFWIAEDSDYDL